MIIDTDKRIIQRQLPNGRNMNVLVAGDCENIRPGTVFVVINTPTASPLGVCWTLASAVQCAVDACANLPETIKVEPMVFPFPIEPLSNALPEGAFDNELPQNRYLYALCSYPTREAMATSLWMGVDPIRVIQSLPKDFKVKPEELDEN